ncbi:MAG: NAD-dependent epimerase/dehydratase [Microgenomates group bacterium Gr01-1014_16]|nr:MAG: NAD-dependent epimerase/dehydratase [Microgenomates group bacterium Gr01-1014_16]
MKKRKIRAVVTGAGGFIGHHLVKFLKKKDYWVRGVDIKYPEFEKTAADEFLLLDLRFKRNALKATKNVDQVYNLASNMGGIGFIDSVKARLMNDNILIDTSMLEASRQNKVNRFFYPSSALVYPDFKEPEKNLRLKESYAYPALPDSEYGWEKLFAERLCADYYEDYGLETRVARFHNIYGPLGAYEGGREKSPAAICRKIALARDGDEIEVWGDGKQMRSYCYIDDCLQGIYRLTHSEIHQPVNIGSDHPVSINEFIDIVSEIAGKSIKKRYDLSKPQGVRSRNSDNTLVRKLLKWEPKIPLKIGIKKNYDWIKNEIDKKKKKKNL